LEFSAFDHANGSQMIVSLDSTSGKDCLASSHGKDRINET
jgi:hypothetical protein